MAESLRDLLKRALALPPADRVALARELLGSVEEDADAEDLDAAFVAELNRRAACREPGIPADEVFADLEKRLARRRRARRGEGD